MILQKLAGVCSALPGGRTGPSESVTLLTSHFPEATLHIFYPQFQSSKFQILTLTPGNGLDLHLASFIHWVGRAMGRVTNSLAVTRKSWMARCSPRAPEF